MWNYAVFRFNRRYRSNLHFSLKTQVIRIYNVCVLQQSHLDLMLEDGLFKHFIRRDEDLDPLCNVVVPHGNEKFTVSEYHHLLSVIY